MKKKHLNSFQFVNNKILNEIHKKDKERLFKYRRVRRNIIDWENEIEFYKNEIEKRKEKINRYNEILNHLYNQIPSNNIYEYESYKSTTKSLYLGKENVIREIICKRNNKKINIEKGEFLDLLYMEIRDNLVDWVIDLKNEIFNNNITFKELIN